MKHIFYILFFLLFSLSSAIAQQKVMLHIYDENNEALIGANIFNKTNQKVSSTNLDGIAYMKNVNNGDIIEISFTGYESKSINYTNQKHLTIRLKAGVALDAVEVKASTSYLNTIEKKHVETITSGELKKAACCDLSESFETNAAVDVGQSDAATGSKKIRFLGLSGKYTQLQIENIPTARGLNISSGLTHIPGTWVESIDVSKGAGSIENGSEAMTGQINVRLLQAENTEKLFVNLYGNSFGRIELNLHTATKLSDKWATSLLLHGNYLDNEVDNNDDNFLDVPKSKRINVLNRWKFNGDNLVGNWNLQVLSEEKNGGQIGFSDDNHETSPLYGLQTKTNRFNFFGKNGVKSINGNADHQAAILYSVDYTDVKSYFGRRDYDATQLSAFINGFFLTKLNYGLDEFKVGANLFYDEYDEKLERIDPLFETLDLSKNETVYGAYAEYTHQFNKKFSSVLSTRYDHSTLYGGQFIPRLHLKYDINSNTILRANAGKGVRTSNPIIEQNQVLVSNREIYINDDLAQEVSWNFGTSFQKEFDLFDAPATFVADYYYTFFDNKIVTDLDSNPNKVYFKNLDGKSDAHSFQAELNFRPLDGVDIKTAYKFYDVRSTINGKYRAEPLVSKHRYFLNIGYEFPNEKFRIDWTGQVFGKQRIPDTSQNPEAYQLDEYSPTYMTMNAQVSYSPSDKLEFYVGGENLLNYKQNNPILGADEPFGDNFDASLNWGPTRGIMIYTGVRWNIFK